MTFLARLLLFFMLAIFPSISAQTNSRETVHKAMHSVLITAFEERGGCTAYAVGPHTIAIAEHCLGATPAEPESILFTFEQDGGVMATNVETVLDGNDHALVVLEDVGLGGQYEFKGFNTWIYDAFPAYIPQQGDRIFMYGAPLAVGCTDCYREGYFSGWVAPSPRSSDRTLMWFSLTGAPGDSGALIFDASGHVVGEVSIGANGFIGCFGFSFTAADLKHIK